MQVNNEPNLYARHGHRPESYSPKDYHTEFGEVIQALEEDERITRVNRMLVGLSLALNVVWETGFVNDYGDASCVEP